MSILRATLITLLVTAASLAALLIPLPDTVTVGQPLRATAATISLVDSLPSAKTNMPSVPKQTTSTTERTEGAEPSGFTPTPALPSSEGGIVELKAEIEPLATPVTTEEKTLIQKEEQEQGKEEEEKEEKILEEGEGKEDSVSSEAASAVSPDPLPSLVDGYHQAANVDQGPSFDRAALASRISYPNLAKRQGMEGLVMLRLYIGSSGKVERVEVEEDPGYGLAQAAIRAFTGLQGKPAVHGGKAVPVTLRYPVRFSLE